MKKKLVAPLLGVLAFLCGLFAMNTGTECEALAAEDVFEMTPGGSIRIAEPYGLRFQVKMSADVKEKADKVGMLIFPADYLVDNGVEGDVYYESVEALAATTVKGHKMDLDLTNKVYEKDGYWYGNGAIVNIKDNNMSREFVGIAYYEVDDTTIYADTSKVAGTTRSAAQVALLTHADKTNTYSDEVDELLLNYIDYLKATDVEESAPTRYKVRGYAADNGLRFHVVQYVDNIVETGDEWHEQTHLEAQIWQHNIGQGVEHGFGADTYCAFMLDGTSWFNNYTNIENVTNDVTISDRGEDYTDGYRYEICYEIFIEFDNNLENPADGPYAYVHFKHHMPGETEEGFENAYSEYREYNRHLWQDVCNSYEFRATGIVRKDVPSSMVTLNTAGEFRTVAIGEEIWTKASNPYTFYEMPSAFIGAQHISHEIQKEIEFRVNKPGYIYVLTPFYGHSSHSVEKLDLEVYNRLNIPEWYLASFSTKVKTWAYERKVEVGETITIPSGGWYVVVISETKIDPTVHNVNDITFADDELAVLKPSGDDTIKPTAVGQDLWSDREGRYYLETVPYWMKGKNFIYGAYDTKNHTATVTRAGKVFLLASSSNYCTEYRRNYFTNTLGFEFVGDYDVAPFSGGSFAAQGFGIWVKTVKEGDTVTWGNQWAVPIFYSDVELPAEPPVSIEITQMPSKTTYKLGEDFDATGMVVMGVDKQGNKVEIPAEDYITVPTTFTTDVYAAAVIVDDLVAAIPVTITDENGNEIVDEAEYDSTSYINQKSPVVNGSVRRSALVEVISTIKKMEADGATAFNINLVTLDSKYQNVESFRKIADCTDYPVMAIAYGNNDNVEWRIGLMKMAVEAGFDIVDIPMNTYDSDSQSSLTECAAEFASANPQEVSMDSEVIEKQKALIQEFKNMGAEVLISAHTGVALNEAQALALAKEMESRGAEVAKIVLGTSVDQKEVMQANVTLKRELDIKFYLNATGDASRPYRTASTLFGSHMIFCYAEYHPWNLTVYDYIVDLMKFYDTVSKVR